MQRWLQYLIHVFSITYRDFITESLHFFFYPFIDFTKISTWTHQQIYIKNNAIYKYAIFFDK